MDSIGSYLKAARKDASYIAVGVIGAGALFAAAIFAPVPKASQPITFADDCKITIEAVRSGASTIDSYLAEAVECMPDLREAKDDGYLLGAVYQPNIEILSRTVKKAVEDKPTRELITLEKAINFYRSQTFSDNLLATIFPASPQLTGYSIPHYIVVNKSGLENATDFEIRALLHHENKHVVDTYTGMRLTRVPIDKSTAGDYYGLDFVLGMLEVRAYADSLRYIVQQTNENGSSAFSDDFIYNIAHNFNAYFTYVEAENDSRRLTFHEMAFWDAQKRELEGISVKIWDTGVVIDITDGIKGKISIK